MPKTGQIGCFCLQSPARKSGRIVFPLFRAGLCFGVSKTTNLSPFVVYPFFSNEVFRKHTGWMHHRFGLVLQEVYQSVVAAHVPI